MMLYPPMNQLLKEVPSRYMLVNVVAQRARQIASEAEDAGHHRHPRGGRGQGGPAGRGVREKERQAPGRKRPCACLFWKKGGL